MFHQLHHHAERNQGMQADDRKPRIGTKLLSVISYVISVFLDLGIP